MEAHEGPPDGSIRDRFLEDHRQMEALLGDVVLAFESNDRERVASIWTEFDARLVAHMDAEERHLLPLLMRTNERAARAILEEHKHFRSRLAELATGIDLHTVRLPAARAFIDELKAHSAHEDKMLYAWADQHVDAGKRASVLASLMDGFKARLLARTGVVL